MNIFHNRIHYGFFDNLTIQLSNEALSIMESKMDSGIRHDHGTAKVHFPLWNPKWIHRRHDAFCELMLDHKVQKHGF